MGRMTIINNSTLTDLAAGYRVLSMLAGDLEHSLTDTDGNVIIDIKKSGKDIYIVSDI